tara:strand:- start:2400 stop:4187 length:1788 start_codon:yes stop_codon:yes gene_type:complete
MPTTTPTKDIEFKYNLGLYFGFLKKYKLIFGFLMIVILLVEIRNITEKYFLKLLIDEGGLFSAGMISKDAFIGSLYLILFYYLILILVSFVLYWFRPYLINRLMLNTIVDMKRRFFKHILELDHNFHTTHKTGSLISRLTRGTGAMERMTEIISFNFVPLILQLIIIVFTISYFDVSAVLVILVTCFVHVSYSVYVQRLQEESSIDANLKEDIEKGNMADFFTNVDSIKYYGKEKMINKKYRVFSEETKMSFLRNWDYFIWMRFGQNIILSLGTILLVYFTMMKFLDGVLTIGTLAFIYATYLSLIVYMFAFVGGLRGFYRAMADFQELFQYNKLSNEIKDKPNAGNLRISNGSIEFRDVGFNFGKRKIFEDFNLKIRSNEKVALVGHSGSGKTTLIKLLKRFYDVDKGSVLIDGVDIKEYRQESVRGEVGIVPQECILFDDSLYNNIKFASPNASREEVMNAIRFAQLDKIIGQFPYRERTVVGERGVRLSGGEKQRVSIARAILANKKILLLDEATSALDSETESEIQRDLKELLKGRTAIIIAHRLSTIMNADRIIVFKNGKIVQEGKHSELITRPGEYKKLWNLQKGGYIK